MTLPRRPRLNNRWPSRGQRHKRNSEVEYGRIRYTGEEYRRIRNTEEEYGRIRNTE